jgi:hypothetical protein
VDGIIEGRMTSWSETGTEMNVGGARGADQCVWMSAGKDRDEDDEGDVGEEGDGRHDATAEPPRPCVCIDVSTAYSQSTS